MTDPKPMADVPESDVELRIDAIAEMFLDQLQAGETADRKALVSAHPEIAGLLERHLALVEMMHWARVRRARKDGVVGEGNVSSPEGGGSPDGGARRRAEDPPEQVGSYSILMPLGVGGMGEVYLAEQVQPVRRQVALKLIKLGMDTREVVARFDAERQAVALMNHPHIAQVYEAGAAQSGRPYFVMEYVPGEPITDFCDTHRLGTSDRLRLFSQVCDAVQHAHQKGVIHRDLKPSNILVMLRDGKPVPKIIDFGVAKATNQNSTERMVSTEQGRMIGTPEYMSPEQAGTGSLAADTRSDVYSLGVILYELLVGTLPFESEQLRKLPYDEIRRRIREEDPPRPSTRLRTEDERGSAAAARRRSDPSTLARILERDLDWVVMKAIEKDPSLRYSTVAELLSDVSRYLDDEPVLARSPSAIYRAGKFIRKHKGTVAGVLSVAAALLAGLVASTVLYLRADAALKRAEQAWQAETEQRTEAEEQREAAQAAIGQAQTERDRAETAAAREKAVNDFLQDMLSSVDPAVEGREVKVVEILDGAAEEIETSLGDHPTIAASLRDTIGQAYQNLGLYEKAEPQLRWALETRRRVLGDKHRDTLRSMNNFAGLLLAEGRLDEAEPLFRQTLEDLRRIHGDDHRETLWSMNNMAGLLMTRGKFEEAERLFRRVLKVRLRIRGEGPLSRESLMSNLAGALSAQGKLGEAEKLFRRVLRIRVDRLGKEHPNTLGTMGNLASLYQDQGKFAEAESLLRRVLEGNGRIRGEEHPATLGYMRNLATLLQARGKLAEAGKLYRQCVAGYRKVLGEEHLNTLMATSDFARWLRAQGRPEEAEPLLLRVLDVRRRVLGEDHPNTQASAYELALALWVQGKHTEAEPLFRRALDGYRRLLGEEHPATLTATLGLASLLLGQGKPEEAEALERRVLAARRRLLGEEHPRTLAAAHNLAVSLHEQSQLGEAEQLFRQVLDARRRVLGEDHPDTLASLKELALFLQDQLELEEAERLRRGALEGFQRTFGEEHPKALSAMGNLTFVLEAQGELPEAEEIGRKAVQIAQRVLPEGDWRTGALQSVLGKCLTKLKRYEEAEAQLLEGYRVQKAELGDGDWRTQDCLRWLVDLYEAWGRPDRAREYRDSLPPVEGDGGANSPIEQP